MTEPVSAGAALAAPSQNVFARLFGVLTSPRATFAGIVARPKWLGAMAVVTIFIAIGQFVFLSTPVGQEAMVDQQVHQTERWSGSITQAQIDAIESRAPIGKYIASVAVLIVGPIFSFLIAGILLGVFNAALGGDATYKQVLAVTSHAGAVSLVSTLFVLPLNYVRQSMTSATNLGVFVPFLEDTNFIAKFLGWFDLFFIWGMIVNAIGLAVLYKRRTAPIFWTFMAINVVVALIGALLSKG